MFGFIFYLFNVNLNEGMQIAHTTHHSLNSSIVIKHLKYNVHNDPSTTVNVTQVNLIKYDVLLSAIYGDSSICAMAHNKI